MCVDHDTHSIFTRTADVESLLRSNFSSPNVGFSFFFTGLCCLGENEATQTMDVLESENVLLECR